MDKGSKHGLLVLNLGRGMPAALAAKFMRETGARVISIAEADPFEATYPAFGAWCEGTERMTVRQVEDLLGIADVCIVGGEDHPDLERSYDPATLSAANPRLIVLAMSGYGNAEKDRSHAAVDFLVQARSGMVWEHCPDRPVAMACPLPTYGMVLQGVLGIWTALVERLDSGQGQVVATSMLQGAATFWAQYWFHPFTAGTSFDKYQPRGVRQLVFKCADSGYIQVALGTPGSLAKLYTVLGIDSSTDSGGRGQPDPSRGLKNYFGDTELIARHVAQFERKSLLETLWQSGVAAEPVLAPGECWDHEQVEALGIITTGKGGRHVDSPIRHRRAASPQPNSQAKPTRHKRGGPLQEFRIIDCGAVVAGPFASALLSDLGADVIKVEPLTGDFNRSQPRTTAVANRGKRSVAIDAKSSAGNALLRQICASADAVHHNFRIGVADRLGLDHNSLSEVNPGIVTLETSSYGPSGPKSHLPGFDMVIQALCGHETRAGGQSNSPVCCRSPFIDFAAGALGAIAIVRGLYDRKALGQGAALATSLIEAGLFLISELVQTADGRFIGAPSLDSDQCGFTPAESLYRTRDGWIAVAARSPSMLDRFLAALHIDAASHDWIFSEEGWASIRKVIAKLSTAEALERLQAAEVWCEPCVENGWVGLAERSDGDGGSMLRSITDHAAGDAVGWFGSLFTLSRSKPTSDHLFSPRLGEHSAEVLSELGYSNADVAELAARGVIVSPARTGADGV